MKYIVKYLLLFLLLISATSSLLAQDSSAIKKAAMMYHPELDAKKQIDDAVKIAKQQNKQVLLMVGGNWCRWCRMFQKFIEADATIDSMIKKDFVMEHINYSKEVPNLETLKALDFPQRFGYPVFVILDANGKRIHTQNSEYLEDGEGYSKERTLEFLNQWSPRALDPKQYEQVIKK